MFTTVALLLPSYVNVWKPPDSPSHKLKLRLEWMLRFSVRLTIKLLDELEVEYTISVPHARYHSDNDHIKRRCR